MADVEGTVRAAQDVDPGHADDDGIVAAIEAPLATMWWSPDDEETPRLASLAQGVQNSAAFRVLTPIVRVVQCWPVVRIWWTTGGQLLTAVHEMRGAPSARLAP